MSQRNGTHHVVRTENLRKDLKIGELVVHAVRGVSMRVEPGNSDANQRGINEGVLASGGDLVPTTFRQFGVERLKNWFETRYGDGVALTYRQPLISLTSGISVSIPDKGDKSYVAGIIIDADPYPFYGEITDDDGTPFAEMIDAPTDVVLSQNLAGDIDAEVGDTVQISGASEDFTLRGIVPTSEKGGFENIIGALLGYYYLELDAVSLFSDVDPGADPIYVRLDDPRNVDDVANTLAR